VKRTKNFRTGFTNMYTVTRNGDLTIVTLCILCLMFVTPFINQHLMPYPMYTRSHINYSSGALLLFIDTILRQTRLTMFSETHHMITNTCWGSASASNHLTCFDELSVKRDCLRMLSMNTKTHRGCN